MISSRASRSCCRARVARSFSTGNKRFSGFIHQGRCRVMPALMLINGQNAIFWHADTMNDNTLQTFPLSPLQVAVVGAGISGLSAAWFMAGQGMTVRVFESGERVGGKIRTLGQNGALFEAGPNTLMAGDEHLAWLDKLGLQVEYPSAQSRHRFVLSQGRYRRLPGGPGALLFGDFFSMGAKWRMLSEPFRRNRPATRPETVAGFFRRRLGDEVLAKAVNPFVGGVFAGDPEQLLIDETLGVLAEVERTAGSISGGMLRKALKGGMQRRNTYSLSGGLESLPRALARTLDVRLSCPVTALRPSGALWQVEAGGQSHLAEQVVLALPAFGAARLLEEIDAEAAAAFAAIRYAPMTVVVTRLRCTQVMRPLEGFGGLNPAAEGAFAAGHLMTGALYPGRCAEGEMLITSFVGGAQYAAHAALADEELLVRLNRELADLFGVEGEACGQVIVRWPEAIAQGSVEVLAAREAAARLAARGIHVCASFLDGVSVPDCMDKGKKLALQLAGASPSLP
ncbi:protoporphyrinogen oxidase [Rhodobacteraceae bacterium CH30]|nr:protoporphyrinogen oxidase [Rhodobacteraceae bacterium CH30]